MSSHHIIRENQEPALFIGDPEAIADDLLNQLLEWSPTLISTEAHYETLKSRGIKVDVLLNNGSKTIDFLEENLIQISYSGSYYPELFSFLREKKNLAVNMLVSQVEKEDLLPYLQEFDISILSNSYKFLFLKKFEKWLPAGRRLWLPDNEQEVLLENCRQTTGGFLEVIQDGFVRMPEQLDYQLIGEEL